MTWLDLPNSHMQQYKKIIHERHEIHVSKTQLKCLFILWWQAFLSLTCGYIMFLTVYQTDLAFINLHLYKWWIYVYLIKSKPPEANTCTVYSSHNSTWKYGREKKQPCFEFSSCTVLIFDLSKQTPVAFVWFHWKKRLHFVTHTQYRQDLQNNHKHYLWTCVVLLKDLGPQLEPISFWKFGGTEGKYRLFYVSHNYLSLRIMRNIIHHLKISQMCPCNIL